jgi:hypothetical protein
MMEIPTDKIIEKLNISLHNGTQGRQTKLDAVQLIKAQALEIQELQAVIVRLRDEVVGMTNELSSENAKIIELEKTS